MDSQSLDRASQYLNNLLLSRGLLSNGKAIEFACPNSNGQRTAATMSRVINLVHDLVLRRDQDAEQREFFADALNKARTEEQQRILDLQRLQNKNADLARQAAMAQAQQRNLKEVAHKAEAQAKELKEQMLKMKSTLDQVRAKCLSDVRKRDVELDKLKTHLSSMQRGKREATGMKSNTIGFHSDVKGRERRNDQDVNSTDWSLEKETNDFLRALVNETSTENVSLRKIITETMQILRDLTGLEQEPEVGEDEEKDGIGIPGQYRNSRKKAADVAEDPSLISCTALAEQLGFILQHCQTILKDPSFVPLEEVQIRDEEILKLRAGWEKMASRWKEAVTMMDSRRPQKFGLGDKAPSHGLPNFGFGKSVAMLPNGQPVFSDEEESSSIVYDDSHMTQAHEATRSENDTGSASIHVDHNEQDQESDLDIPPEPSPKRRASAVRRAGLNIGKPLRPLQMADTNTARSPRRAQKADTPSRQNADSGIGSPESPLDVENEYMQQEMVKVRRNDSYGTHMSLTLEQLESPPCSPLSVPEKLAAIEVEALEHTRTAKRKHGRTNGMRRTRRRSTLSPDELVELMGIE
jgi:hypothetical protein